MRVRETGVNHAGARSPRAGPLAGFRVLDMSSVVMGPYATQVLADSGAEVITIEPIGGGENRLMGPGLYREFSGISLNLLRNKKSVSLNTKDPAARAAVLRVAATCDVAVTNLRPRTLKGLQLSYEHMREVRPDIVYCQAQGFRSDGARGNDPAYDDIIQAESGIADASRRVDGTPRLAPTILADKVCGLMIVQAVTMALLHHARTGEGQRIEVPMLDVMRAFTLVEHGAGAIASPGFPAGYNRVLASDRGPQRTADGWINILPYSRKAYDALFAAGGRDDLVGDARTADTRSLIDNANALYQELRPIIRQRTTPDWIDFCTRNEIPAGIVATLDELVAELPMGLHPDVGAFRSIPSPVWFEGSPISPPEPAPLPGRDTRTVLAAAGMAESEIEDLFARGVAFAAEKATPLQSGQAVSDRI